MKRGSDGKRWVRESEREMEEEREGWREGETTYDSKHKDIKRTSSFKDSTQKDKQMLDRGTDSGVCTLTG